MGGGVNFRYLPSKEYVKLFRESSHEVGIFLYPHLSTFAVTLEGSEAQVSEWQMKITRLQLFALFDLPLTCIR